MSFWKNLSFKLKTFQFTLNERRAMRQKQRFHEHDEKLVQMLALKKQRWPAFKQIKLIPQFLSPTEKLIARILCGVIIICATSLLVNFYISNTKLIAKDGGNYTEGLVGIAHYINPLYAQANDVDMDLSSLIYSGLMKMTDTGPITDLADSYEISEDNKTYTFFLKPNVQWHTGEAFSADDIIFTFTRLTDSKAKSPLYFSFKSISVEKVDNLTVKFTLKEPFVAFLESLSLGILPEHIWKNIQPENMLLAEFNLKPIGTGPYKFKSLVKNKTGNLKTYTLEKNVNYYTDQAHIDTLTFKFHQTFDAAVEALNNKNVEGISYLPKEIRSRIINNRNLNFHLLQLPQYSAVFFNYRNNPILKDAELRKILISGVNKEKIVNEILNAEASAINGPILPGSLGYAETPSSIYNPEEAQKLLEKAGWVLANYKLPTAKDEEGNASEEEYPYQVRKNKDRYLEFGLTTVNQPENVAIAKELQKSWQQIGVKVNLRIVESSQIQETLKNRDYETLLYGQILGYDPDPYPFWHSSQESYPGLNLTSLVNPELDKILDEARKTSDTTKRAEKYIQFQKLMTDSVPAIFLYNPTYTYPQNKKIKGFETQKIILPANRFNDITSWYIKTDRVWNK